MSTPKSMHSLHSVAFTIVLGYLEFKQLLNCRLVYFIIDDNSLLAHIWNSQSPNYQVTEGPRTRLNCRHFTNCFINSLATKSHAFFHHQIRAWKPDVDTIVSDNAKYGGKQIISVTPRLYDYILGNVREPEVSPDQAQLLAMLVQVQGAKRCIEVGIYTEDAFIPDWQQWTFFIRCPLSDSYILEHGKSVW